MSLHRVTIQGTSIRVFALKNSYRMQRVACCIKTLSLKINIFDYGEEETDEECKEEARKETGF